MNPYGRSELHAEEMLNDVSSSGSQWQVACLRYFNPAGMHGGGPIGGGPGGAHNSLTHGIAQAADGYSHFRLAEVEALLGDPSNSREPLGCMPHVSFSRLIAKAVSQDLRLAERGGLVVGIVAGRWITTMNLAVKSLGLVSAVRLRFVGMDKACHA